MKAKKSYVVKINNEVQDVYVKLKAARAYIAAKKLTTEEDFTYEIIVDKTYSKVLISSSKMKDLQQSMLRPTRIKVDLSKDKKPRGRPKKQPSVEEQMLNKPLNSYNDVDDEFAELLGIVNSNEIELEYDEVETF